jgi:putative heme-binding domain-containing protein
VERREEQTKHIAAALLTLEDKLERRGLHVDSDWEPRFGELVQELAKRDARLPRAIVNHRDFGHSPGDVLLVEAASQGVQRRAAEVILTRIGESPDYRWTPQLVFFLGRFADEKNEFRRLIREQHESFAVRSAVLQVLAERPEEADREKFVAGLDSSSHETLAACLDAVARLPAGRRASEQIALVKLLRSLGYDEAEQPLRESAIQLLNRNLGEDFGFVTGKEGRRPQTAVIQRWTDHVAKLYPEEARQALEAAGEDAAALAQLLDSVDWSAGDAARGKELFTKRSCANCHGGSRALGPDLAGVGRRFSRRDLFTAIALPNRDVPPRYQTTYVQTKDGRQVTGLVIYDSVDGVILRDADNRTHRVEGADIELRTVVPRSLMPGGLLKGLAPRDVADLGAYLDSI